jgi:hypothetical protein
MKLYELKNWINSLPEEFFYFDVVNAESGETEEFNYRLDKPIVTLDVDEETQEVLIITDKIEGDIDFSKTE